MAREATIRAEARWRAVVSAWSKSGQEVGTYCEEHGVNRSDFYRWRKRLQRLKRPEFIPVHVVARETPRGARPLTAGAGVEVVLRGGVRLRLKRGFDPTVLSAAVRVLAEGGAC